MKQFIFNPEHDLCLADGGCSFIPPVSAVEFARKCSWIERYMGDGFVLEGSGITSVVPWGWNRCLKNKLLKEGYPAELLPSDVELEFIREVSRRETAMELLEYLHKGISMLHSGDSASAVSPDYRIAARSLEEMEEFLQQWRRVVLKAPLSGSGKGVRFVTDALMDTDRGWCRRTLQRQGAVIVERRMEVVQEFAMLFEVTGSTRSENAGVKFRGYSMFYASNGAYRGNLLVSNEYIEQKLCGYIPKELLEQTRLGIMDFLEEKLLGRYTGFVGVDQFVAKASDGSFPTNSRYIYNPAMELNLRMTMGLVARNIYDFHSGEFGLGEGTHCFEPEKGVFKI